MGLSFTPEKYMNTGIQRSSRTPEGAWTNTTPTGQNSFGKKQQQKPFSLLLAEHNIAYAATCSPAHMQDFRKKIRIARDKSHEGFTFLHVLAPCPTGWKSKPELIIQNCRDAVKTNYFPLWESSYGQFKITVPVKEPLPVTEFLKNQKRFSHMSEEQIANLQETVNANYEHLLKLCK